MKIVMVASEARPFVKTGGLADVVYSLSKELVAKKKDVSVIIPFYKQIKDRINPKVEHAVSFPISMSWRKNTAVVYKTVVDGIKYYLVDCDTYFNRDSIYGDPDDMEKFAFLSMATKEILYRLDINPDIIHIHDWHVGMVPCLFKEDPYARDHFKKTKFVLTIHNPAFQGLIDKYFVNNFYNLPDSLYDNGNLRFKEQFSTLKAGIVYADKIVTVSPTHRCELLTSEGGMGLDDVLKYRDLDFSGILNGIDTEDFNPLHDKNIFANYGLSNFASGKAKNKAELFKELHIVDKGKACFSVITRVTWQKGMDLLFAMLHGLAKEGCNIIILGSGEKRYEEEMDHLQHCFPETCAVYIGYNDKLAHKIYAASDIFLMPSLFEPCGLAQMISQRYGTLPLVRYTGGLADSVIGYDGNNEETANGFGFYYYSIDALRNTVNWAIDAYNNKKLFNKLIRNALNTNNSWSKSADLYLDLYKSITK